MTVTFTYWEVYPTFMDDADPCRVRSLEFHDGDTLGAPLIGSRYCGHTGPPTVTSSGSAMTVILASVYRVFGQFSATYSVRAGTHPTGRFSTKR